MSFLALLLLTPWFAVLGWLYCYYQPAKSDGSQNISYISDILVIVLAVMVSIVAMLVGQNIAQKYAGGNLWPEIVAAVLAYKAYLFVLIGAWVIRKRIRLSADSAMTRPVQ